MGAEQAAVCSMPHPQSPAMGKGGSWFFQIPIRARTSFNQPHLALEGLERAPVNGPVAVSVLFPFPSDQTFQAVNTGPGKEPGWKCRIGGGDLLQLPEQGVPRARHSTGGTT